MSRVVLINNSIKGEPERYIGRFLRLKKVSIERLDIKLPKLDIDLNHVDTIVEVMNK